MIVGMMMDVKYVSYFVALMLFGVLCVPLNASAQFFEEEKLKAVPHFTDFSTEEFKAKTELIEDEPYSDSSLAFSVRLPEGWSKIEGVGKGAVPGETKVSILREVARYSGPATPYPPSFFSLELLDMEYDITANIWFLNYILENAFNLQGMKLNEDGSVEGLYVRVIDDRSYVVRCKVQINGSRMTMASYGVPDTRWNDERTFQDKAIEFFEFYDPLAPQGEKKITYNFLDMVRFEYPASWRQVTTQTASADSAYLRFMPPTAKNKRDLSQGLIEVQILSTEISRSLEKEVAAVQKDMIDSGWRIKRLLSDVTDDYNVHDTIEFHRVDIYEAENQSAYGGSKANEIWFAVLADRDFLYFVKMIAPRREVSFLDWARNKEVFKTIVETIRP